MKSRAVQLALVCILAANFLAPLDARADDLDSFLIARDYFTDGQFAEAERRFRTLVEATPSASATTPSALAEPSRKYLAASLFSLDQRPRARQVLEEMLRLNPDVGMSPTLFSTPLTQFFYDIRQEMLPALNALREQRRRDDETTQLQRNAQRQAQMVLLRELATREVVRNRLSPATIAIPFGGAQFAAGNIGVGVTFASIETLALTTAIVSVALCPLLVTDTLVTNRGNLSNCAVPSATVRATVGEHSPEVGILVGLQATNVIGWSLFGAAIGGGLLHAILTYRPERREVRSRPAPPGFDQIRIAVGSNPATPLGLSIGFQF